MTVKKGLGNTGIIHVSAGFDSVTIKPIFEDAISILTSGMYISNTSVVLSNDEAFELAIELIKMVRKNG